MGDFDNSGTADLAIGAAGEDMGKIATKTDAGAVNVLYGGAGGLTDTGNQIWTAANTVGSIESGDRFGSALG